MFMIFSVGFCVLVRTKMIDDCLYRPPFVEFLWNLWRVKYLAVQFPKVALILLSMQEETLNAERTLRAGARGYGMKREASKNVLTSIHRRRVANLADLVPLVCAHPKLVRAWPKRDADGVRIPEA